MRIFFVNLVLGYLRFFAKLQLRKFSPDIIGITGSAGKTSTRNAVEAILKNKYRLKSSWKANSESGIPLDILGISPSTYSILDWLRMLMLAPLKLLFNWKAYEKYVVEMGIDSPQAPKNMEYLLTIIKPRTGIVMNALPVHADNFDRLVKENNPDLKRKKIIDLIASEKCKLVNRMGRDGLAIYNLDDEAVAKAFKNPEVPVMTFGQGKNSSIRIGGTNWSQDGTEFEFFDRQGMEVLKLPYLLPEHYAYTFAAALCINQDEGNSLKEGCGLLKDHFKLPPGRMSLFRGVSNSLIIDSSYNSSAGPLLDALEMLSKLKAKRRLVLLGDMRELGELTKTEHEAVIKKAMITADQIHLVGPQMKKYGLPLIESSGKQAFWYENAIAAGQTLKKELRQGDVILIKGSQNTIFLETAVQMLLSNSEDSLFLCRRGAYWDRVRSLTQNI